MAEEVPISDVLCNATEYLRKLGSNLQSRSENLKHRRITKDKLRNAHAVRKAASKLLLLCELSKKSLENVENGVKRVLTIVDSSRRSPIVGAKSEMVSLERRSLYKEYFYFEYDSYKLKISKKILLKHYTSLKVHAKSMPATMLDKYPVYYNCNLYQKRKKAKASENENKYEVKDVAVRMKKNSEKNETLSSDSHDTGNVNIDLAKENESDDVSKTPKIGENITEKTHNNGTGESNSKNEKGIKSVSQESETESKHNETLLKKDNESEKNRIDVLQTPCDVEKDMENLDSHTDKAIKMDKAKKNHCDMVCETSSEPKPQSESNLEPELISESISDENKPTEEKDNELRIKYIAGTTRKSKCVRFLYETSESSCEDNVKGNDRKKRKLDKESECNDIVDLIDESPKKTEMSHELTEKTEQKCDESESKPKPMLKLVSLDKLLKPDVIQKLEGSTDTKVLKQTSIKTYRGKIQKRDETCLLEKRKEVSGFKPKKFHVIVMRLPKFCDSFLCKYGLKTIVRDGYIVYKKGDKEVIGCENIELDVTINKYREKGKNCNDDIADKSKKELDEGVVKTKNALLNSDSDSSDTITKPSPTTKNRTTEKDAVSNTKAALLSSDSDSSESKNRQKTKKKHSLSQTKVTLLDSDSSDSIKTRKTPTKYALSGSKTALLESDSDNSDSKRKSKTSEKKTSSKSKTALLQSDSDNSDSKRKSKTPEKDTLSKSKTALLESDSDNSDSKKKSKTSKKNTSSKSKIAFLELDSDNSDSKKKCKTSENNTLLKSKTALLESDSDKSNSEEKSQTSKKDTFSKSKTALLESDSDNSDSKRKSKTSEKKTSSKSKTALLQSDSDNSDSKAKSKTPEKDTLSKSKTALLESDSDNSDSKRKSRTPEKDTLSKSKTALLESDSDISDSKKKSKTSEKNTSSKSKIAFLELDSDNSDSKKKCKTSENNTLSKSKTALLESDSDKSNSEEKSQTSKKDTFSKSKTALLESDSDNSDSKRKSKTSDKKTSSKSKTALLQSDSDNSDNKGKSKTPEKDTLSKSKTALLESDSDNSDSKRKSKTPEKDTLSKSKTALLESDSDNSNSKKKSKTSEKNTLSKSKTALLESDSDNSDNKRKSKMSEKKTSSKSKALLRSDSDNSDSKGKSKTPEKDTLSKSKTALLEPDSDNSDSRKKCKALEKNTLSKSKMALLDSDSDNSDSKRKSKMSEKKTSSKSKALLQSDSDNSDSKGKSKTPEKDTVSKSKTALLEPDSDNSDSKKKCKALEKNTLSKSKTALFESNSDNSDSKRKSKTPGKDALSASKTALLNSDSENSDSKGKSKTSERNTLSESKSALLESDSDSSSKSKQETKIIDSLSRNKTSLLNFDSDNSDVENNPVKSKKNISITKNALLDSDSHSSDNKNKTALINNPCSERPMSESINEQIETLSCNNEPNESTNLVSDSPSKNGKGNDADVDESNLSKSVESPEANKSKKHKEDQTTPKSKRKMIMESMQAKKMLLNYSSSSDTDDEQLKSALKDVRNSLLNLSSSSDDEINVKKIIKANRRQLVTPSDSDGSLNKSKLRNKRKKEPFIEKAVTSIGQFDGTKDEQSDTSSSQMGRSKTKVASSSNQSSENMDSNDIEINRLTDLSSLNRRRRRDSRKKAGPRSTRKMPKAPLIEEETLGPGTSDAASDVESDVGEVEELPAVSIQDLNGDGINHLAKEDLLAQSDTSSSQNEKANGSEEDKKEESDEEDNVKSIRRKTNAISSDSEVGSSRRKEEKVSDFEDSEADSEPRRKTKRKKKGSDSDASLSSNDGSKKKRRRIKQVNESDASGSDSENEGKNKHGRKNIRKVMSKDQLEEATKKAARQEKERIARIAERQKLYNNLEFDESGKPDEVVLDKVILDFDPDTKEPLIEVDRGLVKKLKPHQANGIKFMWNACFESVKRIKKDRGSGCILAHCMGLGKTLQVVSLTHTLLTHGSLTGVRRVLVVCPLSTVLNWVNEFTMWLKHAVTDYEVDVFELSRHKQNSERSWQLQQWVECGGVCVLGYEMFRNLSADNNKKFKKKMLKTFQEALVDPGPDLVVCDEGHLLKNEKTSLSQSMNRVRTLRRIVLTGTPLQNNLKEYYCMVQFVKPNLLGKYNEYLNRFVNPITNGQYTDSTERDISIMKRRSHVLHTMLDGAVQRRDYGVLAPFLPPKHEFVLFITLTEIQIKLYQHYLDNYSRRPLPGKSSGFLFPDFQSLQRIWTHPLVLKYNSERYEIMQQKKRDKEEEDSEGSIADFIDDDSTPEESSTEESTDDLSDVSDDSRKKSKKKKSAKKGKGKDSKATGRRGTRANPIEMAEEDKPNSDIEEVKYENPTEWWMKLVTDEELEHIRHSHKLLLLFDILRQCEAIGDKLLVFSQSLYSLDLIEHFLGKVDEATQEGRIDEKLAGHVGSWSPGVDYFRLDGSTSCENRSIWCKNFNREDNPRARLFLISTRAGGLGINLVAANRVVIFDVSWNPSHDVQSIFRVYRFGQKKPCYIYRFLAMGTMEEKIYERQVTKQAISKRVIDEQQIDRHYAANDLAELYKFEPEPPEPRPVPSLPKDRLFAEMLKDHEKQIYRFHEHDSLLENKEEETLSEEERKRAWEEFENEKRAPPPAPFPSTWSMHNGMASLLQQQQQQLAYTALAAMIRKDMPNITDNQMRDMLPIICNANPGMFGGYDYGLMQKMNEIYKYAAQPGLMNPSMMNPVMNPASGMSTSSSLQYEPPWQRQQQQQQQMRLQQLMQQQHSMGAKYYAGGLGSRDPVAMALQQQRAREFLLGPGGAGAGVGVGAGAGAGAPAAGRPRGRPPLQPRAPAAADVVNLADSD